LLGLNFSLPEIISKVSVVLVSLHKSHLISTIRSTAWLRERFLEKMIIRKRDVEWASHSLDFKVPYFYLW